jgi:hypothetical protein
MLDDRDHYEAYYTDKLWNLIPALYRAEDTDQFDGAGPLRELVHRIGVQAAILRRSIDRLWEDQVIETCDDWVIPYIADLLATNLVASLDARGQRLDVAKTIYYRRRKGTRAVLEEIAANITGWDARAVEFFCRLGRTRHNLDPAIGLPSETDDPVGHHTLQLAEGLLGALTHTAIGGWADLRNVYGAALVDSELSATVPIAGAPHTAFDEFFHTADFRRGVGQVGWYNIPRLGVFLWRVQRFGVEQTTPVAFQQCSGQYTFDPTGREIPLFAAASRGYGDTWTSPAEWQLPTPITRPLLGPALAQPPAYPLYAAVDPLDGSVIPNALGVFQENAGVFDLIPGNQLTADPRTPTTAAFYIDPPRGRLVTRSATSTGALRVTYHYGFSSTIGAGPYDRRVRGRIPASTPSPVTGGGGNLAIPLAGLAPVGIVTIGDFLTYDTVSDVGDAANGIVAVTVGTENKRRPLIRLPALLAPHVTEWIFTGGANPAHPGRLVLDGLFISGGDIVLRGFFDTVALVCCTLDPGTAGTAPGTYAKAADGRELIPCRLWIEGGVTALTVDRSIVGPIQTRSGGEIETLRLTNSIVQAIGPDPAMTMVTGVADLSRCTILGPAHLHRLEASECILDDIVTVINTQDGCVRFSAYASGSVLPRQYESVEVAAHAPLFTSREFGQPAYAQLLASVDAAIMTGAKDAAISTGAADGSEMGAFARDKNPIKVRSLLLKYQEYMPLGLVPVIIEVT